jgi:parvulin-like peptidyl-prolyl cis-trans isomerase-like protein
MKSRFSVCVLLLAALTPAWAQLVSSHAPTVVAKPADTTLQAVGKPVARVNGAVLTDRDLVREEYTIFPYARQHNGVPRAMEADIRAGAMKMIIFEELVYQEALRRNMTVPPTRLRRAESDFRKQFSNPAEFQDLLNTEFKGSPALLNAKIKRSLLIDQLLKLEVEDRSSVSLLQARAYFDKNPDRFRIPESYAVQTISVIPPENATPAQLKEVRKKAEDALSQAKATKTYEEFGLLAEKISEDDFRVMMGDHRAVDKTKLPPPVVQAASAMQPGQISGLIELDNHAFTIVRLNAHIAAGKQKFEAVSGSLREELKRKKTEDLRRTLAQRLKKNAKVEEL